MWRARQGVVKEERAVVLAFGYLPYLSAFNSKGHDALAALLRLSIFISNSFLYFRGLPLLMYEWWNITVDRRERQRKEKRV